MGEVEKQAYTGLLLALSMNSRHRLQVDRGVPVAVDEHQTRRSDHWSRLAKRSTKGVLTIETRSPTLARKEEDDCDCQRYSPRHDNAQFFLTGPELNDPTIGIRSSCLVFLFRRQFCRTRRSAYPSSRQKE